MEVTRSNFNIAFWRGKKVLITGHTGFKGSWLCLLLHYLGADVYGFALAPGTNPSLFEICNIKNLVYSNIGDIRDEYNFLNVLRKTKPDVLIHMAAQPLVRYSYDNPVETFAVNIMGTVNVLEAVRQYPVKAVVNVTTDKCYENREWCWAYRENEMLGGHDPYSSSKACSELVTQAFTKSYFSQPGATAGFVATARAGNVIGGGDWALDRLIPDFVRAIQNNKKIIIRNPGSVRPWQHVLEPLLGYLMLAEKLYTHGSVYSQAFNFGPDDNDVKTVKLIAEKMCSLWGHGMEYEIIGDANLHEATNLKLDCSKAKALLGWYPRWDLDTALESIITFTKAFTEGSDIYQLCISQIQQFLNNDIKL